MDFSHLQQLDIKDKTVEYPLYQIEGEAVLIMKSATEANKPYFNHILKTSRKNMRSVQSGRINPGLVKDNREKDRKLFSRFVIVGWRGIIDAKGKEVEFNRVNCEDFLEALPDWIFDEIRTFASNNVNFAEDFVDIEATAKNSKSG